HDRSPVSLKLPLQLLHNELADIERGGGPWRWGITDVDDAVHLLDQEVVYHRAIRRNGLGADASVGRFQVFSPDLRDEPLQGLYQRRFVERTPHFTQTCLPVSGRHLQETRVGEGFERITELEIELVIPFTGKGQHRVRTTFHPTVDHAGKMDTQEGEIGVWDRVDEIAAEVLRLGLDFIVFAAKGDNLNFGLLATQSGHTVRL